MHAEQTHTRMIEGAPHAGRVLKDTKARLAPFAELEPTMTVVVASDDPATRVYVDRKQDRARKLGIRFSVQDIGRNATQAELEQRLHDLSRDDSVHGIVLELPLTRGLDADRALTAITPLKDVEGLSPTNLALIAASREDEAILPPTPTSCVTLLEQVLTVEGSRIAVIGPGRTVGRPLVWMLNNRGATVTLCNPFTRDLAAVLAPCDAVIVAVGRPCLLEGRHLRDHHVVIDAGINVSANMIVGDAAGDVPDRVRAVTPVPGGVGPLTSALMFSNFARALELQRAHR